MPATRPYFDAYPAPEGSPRLFGDTGLLAGKRAYAEVRGRCSPSLTPVERRRFRLKMMVTLAYHCGMSQAWIADALDMTQGRVSQICDEIEGQVRRLED